MPNVIDRVSPTLRPNGLSAMRHHWRRLLFLHWEVPVEALRPLVPPQLSIDTFDGRAYVGLVPFKMEGVRPALLPPMPFYSNFPETNVRTYVHLDGRDPGVWFFSLDASLLAAVLGARAAYWLPYFLAKMRETLTDDRVDYWTERVWPKPKPARAALSYRPRGEITQAKVDTLEHFLIERYILYSLRRGRLYSGRVSHQAYPIQTAELLRLEENLVAAAGIYRPDTEPLIHYSPGVDVEVFLLKPAR